MFILLSIILKYVVYVETNALLVKVTMMEVKC